MGLKSFGRGERIRTSDLSVPNRAHYQAVLRPESSLDHREASEMVSNRTCAGLCVRTNVTEAGALATAHRSPDVKLQIHHSHELSAAATAPRSVSPSVPRELTTVRVAKRYVRSETRELLRGLDRDD
jgi:hypothetical protein